MKENFEKRKINQKKEQRYKNKHKTFDNIEKRRAQIEMKEGRHRKRKLVKKKNKKEVERQRNKR